MKVFLVVEPEDLNRIYQTGIAPSLDGIQVYETAADAVRAGKQERLKHNRLYYLNFCILSAELPAEAVCIGLDGQMSVKQHIPAGALCSRDQLSTLIR